MATGAEAPTTKLKVDARLPLRLLVVDDDPVQRKSLEHAARLAGCVVISADSRRDRMRTASVFAGSRDTGTEQHQKIGVGRGATYVSGPDKSSAGGEGGHCFRVPGGAMRINTSSIVTS